MLFSFKNYITVGKGINILQNKNHDLIKYRISILLVSVKKKKKKKKQSI